MKIRIILFLICIILTVFIIRSATRLSKPGFINGDNVNLRAGGSLSAKIISTVKRDTALVIVKKSGFWYRVRLKDGRSGWVYSRYVSLNQPPVAASPNRYVAPMQIPAVIMYAKSFQGAGYTYGGATPRGFDCSGFTMFVFARYGLELPHQANLQMRYGEKVSSIRNLKPADLVFFKTPGSSTINHVGIYLGEDQFIHASSGHGGVTISHLNTSYYRKYYRGARRLKK